VAIRRLEKIEAFDVETITDMRVGPQPYHGKDRIFAWCRTAIDGTTQVHRINPDKVDMMLQDYILDTRTRKICHNLKYEYAMLKSNGYAVPKRARWHDTMIQSQLTDNLRLSHALDYVAWQLAKWSRDLDAQVHKLARAYGGFHKVPVKLMNRYQRSDGQRSMLIHLAYFPQIESNPDLLRDYEHEIDLVQTTERMERTGILYDQESASLLLSDLERELNLARADLLQLTGGQPYNLSSPDEVMYLLYTKFKLPVLRFTGGGKPSTDKMVLAELTQKNPHPILKILERYRAYQKGYGIISGYADLVDSNGVIHPNIQTNRAATGREACSKPNLQNVSKDYKKDAIAIPARRCFRARPGKKFMLVDQSGIEMRLIIEAAGCEKMAEIQRLSDLGQGPTPHEVHCQIGYGDRFISKAESKDMYSSGKNGHFALGYGAALAKWAMAMGMTLFEATPGYKEYGRRFPKIANLATEGMREVQKTGFVETPFGRKLYVPADKAHAWLNYYIQGTAAGIIKRGQTESEKALAGMGVDLLLPIHDEIVFEMDVDTPDKEIYSIMRKAMIEIEAIKVPLDTEAKVSLTTWADAKDL